MDSSAHYFTGASFRRTCTIYNTRETVVVAKGFFCLSQNLVLKFSIFNPCSLCRKIRSDLLVYMPTSMKKPIRPHSVCWCKRCKSLMTMVSAPGLFLSVSDSHCTRVTAVLNSSPQFYTWDASSPIGCIFKKVLSQFLKLWALFFPSARILLMPSYFMLPFLTKPALQSTSCTHIQKNGGHSHWLRAWQGRNLGTHHSRKGHRGVQHRDNIVPTVL